MRKYSYMDVREQMAETAREIWNRKLTNAAGGNFAVRVEPGKILSTPSMMSENKHGKLEPEDMLLIDYDYNILEGRGNYPERLICMWRFCLHMKRSEPLSMPTVLLHAVVAFEKTIHSVTDATEGRGDVECMEYAVPCSEQSVANVMKYFKEREEIVRKKPIGCIMPRHGVIVSGGDIHKAFSMLERIEAEAYCNIVRSLLK